MTGCQASQDFLDPQVPRASQGMRGLGEKMVWTASQGPRESLASEALMGPQDYGVPRASRASKETQW